MVKAVFFPFLFMFNISLLFSSWIENSPLKRSGKFSPDIWSDAEKQDNYIYFLGKGVDPAWTLTIASEQIHFETQLTGYEKVITPHIEPVRAMDSNVKWYSIETESGKMVIELTQGQCKNMDSRQRFTYQVKVSVQTGIDTSYAVYTGCGSYITDRRLQGRWLLQQIKDQPVNTGDFNDTLPFIDIQTGAGSFTGYTGCNTMHGRIFSERTLLRFTDVVPTKRNCAVGNREKEFVNALQFSTQYIIEDQKLIFSNPGGRTLSWIKEE